MSTQESPAALATTADHLFASKLYSLACCVMLFYDIAITFGDEVEKIWMQRFTGATILWFLNRYLSPLGYIVVLVSFNDPNWGKTACDRYVLFPEALKIVTAAAVGVIFILRLYSIYSRSQTILVTFSLLLLAELGVKIWAFTDGTSLQLPPGLVGCILVAKGNPAKRFIFSWVAELCFDSAVFFATFHRTLTLYRTTHIKATRSLITVIMRDGIMYFAAIFIANLITVLFFVLATADLKAVNASFSTLITSLMTSRLMLNLRNEAFRRGRVFHDRSRVSFRQNDGSGRPGTSGHVSMIEVDQMTSLTEPTDLKTFEASIIGNLGAPLTIWTDEEDEDNSDESDGESRYVKGDGSNDDMELQARPARPLQTGQSSQVNVQVQVEEEVVVEETPVILPERVPSRISSTAHSSPHARPPTGLSSKPLSLHVGRRPWTAPPTWKLSREQQRGLLKDIQRTS